MGDGERLEKRPLWVKVGLLGLPNRTAAWAFCWLSIAIVVGCVAYGFVDRRFFVAGLIMVFAALWYYAAIRWADRHGRWS